MVTYEDLLKGRVLANGDQLQIDGIDYQVSHSMGYFLAGIGCDNREIFFKNHLDKEAERHTWARKFGSMVGSSSCAFPEMDTLSQLTEFVKDIYKEVQKLRGIKCSSSKKTSKSITVSLPMRDETSTHIKL